MAFLTKLTKNGKKQFAIIWTDIMKGKGKKGRRTLFCNAHKATNDIDRKILLRKYKDLEEKTKKEFELYGVRDEKEKLIIEAVDSYIQSKKEDVEIRKKRKGREGIAESTFRIISNTIPLFKAFCSIKKIQYCSEFSPKRAQEFKKWLLNAKENASTHHINKILRNIKTFFNHFRLSESHIFKNVEGITAELKQYPTDHDLGFHFKVEVVKKIVLSALQQDNELCSMTREKHDAGKHFDGTLQNKYVPIFPTIILIMLTGMRKNEALSLKWNMVDFDNGVIRIERAQKTGKSRIIPLLTDPSGVISESLVKLLKIWKSKAKDDFVLPHPISETPSELSKPIMKFKQMNGFIDLNFQNLRKSFISYAVSFRIPASNIAFWVGHSVAVSERHYMRYALGLEKGSSIEEAMGISSILRDAIDGYNGKGIYKNLKNTKW